MDALISDNGAHTIISKKRREDEKERLILYDYRERIGQMAGTDATIKTFCL
jgi:hypothetical protein